MMFFVFLYWLSLLGFIIGVPMVFFGALLSIAFEAMGKSVDRYFERRMAKRGHRLR